MLVDGCYHFPSSWISRNSGTRKRIDVQKEYTLFCMVSRRFSDIPCKI
jgi:hypothetical protein